MIHRLININEELILHLNFLLITQYYQLEQNTEDVFTYCWK